MVKQYYWGQQYVDELLCVGVNIDPQDSSETSGGACERWFWALHDANYNVVGLTGTCSTPEMVERYEYTPYGQRTVYSRNFLLADVDEDGDVDEEDSYLVSLYVGGGCGSTRYDLNGDGAVTTADNDIVTAAWNAGQHIATDTFVRHPRIDSCRGMKADGTALLTVDLCDMGMQGNLFDKEFGGIYHWGARYYHPLFGKGMQDDPTGYPDGNSRNEWLCSNPINGFDPSGLKIQLADSGSDLSFVLNLLNILGSLGKRSEGLFVAKKDGDKTFLVLADGEAASGLGGELIVKLISSERVVEIKKSGVKQFHHIIHTDGKPRKEYTSTALWTDDVPEQKPGSVTQGVFLEAKKPNGRSIPDPLGPLTYKPLIVDKVDQAIALAHELIHTYYAMHEDSDPRDEVVNGKRQHTDALSDLRSRWPNASASTGYLFSRDMTKGGPFGAGLWLHEFKNPFREAAVMAEEFWTVGVVTVEKRNDTKKTYRLKTWADPRYRFSENAIRSEFGLPLRVTYHGATWARKPRELKDYEEEKQP